MNLEPNELFPKFQLFEDAFTNIFKNNGTINFLEEEHFDSIFPLPSISLQPVSPLIHEDIYDIDDFFPLRGERIERKIVFKINHKRKRKYNLSNLIRKIKSHFIRFLISFCNDALEEENYLNIPNYFSSNTFVLPNLFNIYNINFNLKEKTIRDILKLDTSYKYSRFRRDENKKLLEEIESLSPRLNDLFQMNSLKLFKYYHNKEKPLNKISFENKEIFFSPKTKTFYDLLEKNKDSREEIIEVAKKYFLFEENDS